MPDLESDSLPTHSNVSSSNISPIQNSATVEQKPSVKSQRFLFSYGRQWLTTWVPIVTAIISILISIYTFVVTTHEPELLLIMPTQVRLAQGGGSGPFLYIRPIFISTGLSERVEVIRNIHVQVEPVNQVLNRVEFVWDEQGMWFFDPNTQELSWVFISDSGPFLVGPKNAQDFTGLFIGPSNWLFEPGTYRITVIADRITNSQPLNASIEVVFSDENIDYLNQSEGRRFLAFPVQQ